MSGVVHACTLAACRRCTPCAHGQHDTCRATVRCPDDHTVRTCACCGLTTTEGAGR